MAQTNTCISCSHCVFGDKQTIEAEVAKLMCKLHIESERLGELRDIYDLISWCYLCTHDDLIQKSYITGESLFIPCLEARGGKVQCEYWEEKKQEALEKEKQEAPSKLEQELSPAWNWWTGWAISLPTFWLYIMKNNMAAWIFFSFITLLIGGIIAFKISNARKEEKKITLRNNLARRLRKLSTEKEKLSSALSNTKKENEC